MKKTAVSLAMLFLMVCFYAQIGLSGARYAREGIEYYQRGEYKRAIEEFLSANRSASDRIPEYHYWLGRLYIAIADTSSAMRWFDKYRSSADEAYRENVDEYLRIIKRQKEIFNKVNLRAMPAYINSGSSDYGAVTDPQKKYLYFTSMRPAVLDKENIWRAEIFKSGYGRPELVKELSTDKNESFGCFNSSGTGAWVFGNYESDKLDGDLYYVPKNGDWSQPENASQFNSSQVDTHPMLFRDRYLFFASSREGGYGGMDIYVCENIGGVWTEPINLGPQINTAGNEQTPFLDYDAKTLFFASNGHAGFGGYDIFKAYHIDTGWQDWSIPENLGLPINSTRNDRCFFHIPASNEGFMSSDRAVGNYEQIYQLSFEYKTPASYLVRDSTGLVHTVEIRVASPVVRKRAEEKTVFQMIDQVMDVLNTDMQSVGQSDIPMGPVGEPNQTSEPQTTRNQPVTSAEVIIADIVPERRIQIQGIVRDQNGEPVTMEFEISCTADGISTREIVTTDARGNYDVLMPEAYSYSVVANPEGFLLYSKDVNLDSGNEGIVHNIILQKIERETPPQFDNIYFRFESSQLDDKSKFILDNTMITLLNNPDLKIRISGHAWDLGTPTYNQELSERRAKTVVDYLISKGIAKDRLSWKAYGNKQPLTESGSENEQAQNRRVEIEVLN
jgi:outer membrane protein OmpA-like peptidoglycan-associated protein